MRIPSLLALALALLGACGAPPPPSGHAGPAMHPAAALWQASGDRAAASDMDALAAAYPDSASVRLRLLNAALSADDGARAAQAVRWLTVRGYAIGPGVEAQLLPLFDPTEQRGLQALLATNRAAKTASEPSGSIPREALLVEAIARSPADGRLWASTVVGKALYVQRADGGWQRVAIEGAGSLSGLAFSPDGSLLWVASSVIAQTPDPGDAFRGLLAIDPASFAIVRRVAAPEGVNPGDIALGPRGEIFVSDPLGGGVYIAYPSAERLAAIVAPGTFRSPQGLAPSPDGRLLHVSDYRYGLAAIDFTNGAVWRVGAQGPFLLDGIDGLWRMGDHLVAVQNGVSPMRIVAIELGSDGLTARALQIFEQAHPEWSEPLGGSLADGVLDYVATGQWERFGPGGSVTAGQEPGPTRLNRLPIAEVLGKTP